jgi:hypothetical protein
LVKFSPEQHFQGAGLVTRVSPTNAEQAALLETRLPPSAQLPPRPQVALASLALRLYTARMFSLHALASPPPTSRRSIRLGGPLQFKSVWPGVEAALVEACVQGDGRAGDDYSTLVEPAPSTRSGVA